MSERCISEDIADVHLLKIYCTVVNCFLSRQDAAHVPGHARETKVVHFGQWYPSCIKDFVWHLDVDGLIAICCFHKSNEVEILLSPLVFKQFSETNHSQELGSYPSLLPDLTHRCILDALTSLYQASGQLPQTTKFSWWFSLLDAQELSPILAEDEATDTDIVASEAWHFVLSLRYPLCHHQVVIFCVMEFETCILNSNSCQVHLIFP